MCNLIVSELWKDTHTLEVWIGLSIFSLCFSVPVLNWQYSPGTLLFGILKLFSSEKLGGKGKNGAAEVGNEGKNADKKKKQTNYKPSLWRY